MPLRLPAQSGQSGEEKGNPNGLTRPIRFIPLAGKSGGSAAKRPERAPRSGAPPAFRAPPFAAAAARVCPDELGDSGEALCPCRGARDPRRLAGRNGRSGVGALEHFAPNREAARLLRGAEGGTRMICTFREIAAGERALLDRFLYEAIFVPPGVPAPPRSILERPELQVYVADFGARADDFGLAAQLDGRTVGAAWARRMRDYGYVDDGTPSLAIALLPEYRGRGIGTALLGALLRRLREKGYRQVSLSVQTDNPAVRLYRRAGFVPVAQKGPEAVMVCRFDRAPR